MNMMHISYTWGQFTPVFILAGLSILILLADTFLPRLRKPIYPLLGAFVTIALPIVMLGVKGASLPSFISSFACLATAACLFMVFDYRTEIYASVGGEGQEDGSAEMSSLLLLACAGTCALTQARDLVMLFLCIECITLPCYVLAGYFRRRQSSVEAGVKYLILGAISTGFLVMGAAWYFGTTGTFAFEAKGDLNPVLTALVSPYFCAGFLLALGMLLSGLFFKVGAVPMHSWIPDVYQGAPTPVTAFLAVVSKLAGFTALALLFFPLLRIHAVAADMVNPFLTAMGIVAAATLLVGNLGAIPQQNTKRLLAYSSIGQAGFILVFFVALRSTFCLSVVNYMIAYGVATIMAFHALATLRMYRGSEEISAFRGLGKTNPRVAFMITVAFASLAGVPLTFGFLVKFNAFRDAIYTMQKTGSCCGWLLGIMIVCAAAGFYYYFKVLRAMYWEKLQAEDTPVNFSPLCVGVLSVGTLILLGAGIVPLIVV